jgi:hypothetical protein
VPQGREAVLAEGKRIADQLRDFSGVMSAIESRMDDMAGLVKAWNAMNAKQRRQAREFFENDPESAAFFSKYELRGLRGLVQRCRDNLQNPNGYRTRVFGGIYNEIMKGDEDTDT